MRKTQGWSFAHLGKIPCNSTSNIKHQRSRIPLPCYAPFSCLLCAGLPTPHRPRPKVSTVTAHGECLLQSSRRCPKPNGGVLGPYANPRKVYAVGVRPIRNPKGVYTPRQKIRNSPSPQSPAPSPQP